MNDWYKDWFNSEFYSTIYSHRDSDDANKLVKLILNNLDIEIHKNIFDCPCGNGRHSIEFAKLGFKVTSMDLSPNLLSLFRDKMMKENLHIPVLRGDIRRIPIKKKFDVILNLFTSFGYFDSDEENFLFFLQAKNLLNKNGKIIFDYFNPVFIKNNLVTKQNYILDGKKIFISREIHNSFILKNISIVDNEKKNNYCEKVKMYSLRLITNKLNDMGFKIENIFGNYSGDSFNELNSERIILVVRV